MSGVIDQIRKKTIIDSPETVNVNWTSPSVSLDDRQGPFSLTLNYSNGFGVNMTVFCQLSTDNVNFGNISSSDVIITDNTGTILYDLEGSGASYARISIVVAAGSIDVTDVYFIGAQSH